MELSDTDDRLLLDWAARIPGDTLAEKLAVTEGGGLAQALRGRYVWLAYRNLPRRYVGPPKERRTAHVPLPVGFDDEDHLSERELRRHAWHEKHGWD